jgi:hypothetical protein
MYKVKIDEHELNLRNGVSVNYMSYVATAQLDKKKVDNQ